MAALASGKTLSFDDDTGSSSSSSSAANTSSGARPSVKPPSHKGGRSSRRNKRCAPPPPAAAPASLHPARKKTRTSRTSRSASAFKVRGSDLHKQRIRDAKITKGVETPLKACEAAFSL